MFVATKSGDTALHLAASEGHVSVVSYLLQLTACTDVIVLLENSRVSSTFLLEISML